ncbi:hypothetical protein N9850_13110, partial [Granulosicoccus sp.]
MLKNRMIDPGNFGVLPIRLSITALVLSSVLVLSGCSDSNSMLDEQDVIDIDDTPNTILDADFEATDWSEETHSNDAVPNYNEVFDDAQVKRLDFVITAERWQSMLDDMTATYGEFGGDAGGPGAGGPPGGDNGGLIEADEDP